jgi:hypothetical protein
MATLKEQLEKARVDRDNIGYELEAANANTKDTKYGKFDDTSVEGIKALAKIKAIAKRYNTATKYYDKILAAYNTEQEQKKLTGEQDGVSESKLAANKGLSVAEYRAEKQKIIDDAKTKRDLANEGAADQQTIATYSQFINTLGADETQLRSVQEDLKKNFPKIYKGGVNGLKDWTLTQSALQSIAEARVALPKNLQGSSIREFLINPAVDIAAGIGGADELPKPFGQQEIYSRSTAEGVIDSIFSALNLGREASKTEIDTLYKQLQAEQKKLSSMSKGTYKMVNGRRVLVQEQGLDSRTFLENKIRELPAYKESQAAKSEKNKIDLASTALANGYNLDTDFAMQLPGWLDAINNGKSVDEFKNIIRATARRILPEAVRNQIAPDEDLTTTFSTYISNVAKARGIPASSVNLNEVIGMATTDKGFADYQQFEVKKRSKAWWDSSPEGFAVTTDIVNDTLKDFGMLGQGVREA